MKNIDIYRRHLPHWRANDATYFVTWRLSPGAEPLSPAERDVVFNAIGHFDGERYSLTAAVVMDDHVHIIVRPYAEYRLEQVVHSWKSFTGHALRRGSRRTPVWLDEYFDRLIRGLNDLLEKANYIATNPQKRWPEVADYRWVFVKDLLLTGTRL